MQRITNIYKQNHGIFCVGVIDHVFWSLYEIANKHNRCKTP